MRNIHALAVLSCIALASGPLFAADVRTVQGRPQIESYTHHDLSWVPRTLKKEPAYASKKVRYCIWVLGNGRKSVMTMAWDESGGTGAGYDTIYADKNFDGDLTEPGERHFWRNVPKPKERRRGKRTPYEKYEIKDVKEADGDKAFHFSFRNVYASDVIEYDSTYQMRSPTLSYDVGPLPGNHKILWSHDLRTAPVYHFGGEAVPITNGKMPGKSMGTWEAGRTVSAQLTTVHFGDRPEAQLRFYGSKFPGLAEAKRHNRWGNAVYPLVYLRTLKPDGSVLEEIRFGDSCPCAGGFGPELLIPSRVPPGKHQLVVRMLRLKPLGGVADFVYPVEIKNPGHGKPIRDPAYLALRARFPGNDVKFASLRRVVAGDRVVAGYPGENVVAARVGDNTMDPTNRDWDPRPVNYGSSRLLAVGVRPHSHADSRTLLKFDLAGVPKGTTILGAQLRLTLVADSQYIYHATGAKLQAFAVRRRWNERREKDGWSAWHGPLWLGKSGTKWGKGGCDDKKLDRDPDPAGAVDVGGFPKKLDPNDKSRKPPREARRLVALDVTALVQAWHTGKLPNHGVLLRLAGKGNGRICSSEFLDFLYRPTLVLAYRGADPKPTYRVPPDEDLGHAIREARRRNKPLLLKFYSPRCGICEKVKKTTFANAKVKAKLAAGYQVASVAIERNEALARTLGVEVVPALVVLKRDGTTKVGAIGHGELTKVETFLRALGGIKP